MVFAWVSAGFPQGFAGFVQVFQFAEGFPRFLRVSFGFLQICLGGWPVFFSGNSETSSQQKLETEKSYHGHCAVLRQILYICRDRFWSHKQ